MAGLQMHEEAGAAFERAVSLQPEVKDLCKTANVICSKQQMSRQISVVISCVCR